MLAQFARSFCENHANLAQILVQSGISRLDSQVDWGQTRQTYTRQIRRGRAHKDRAFVLFTNHGGRQESSDLFALIRISTFYSLRGFFEHRH
jgi:hypothetical protein